MSNPHSLTPWLQDSASFMQRAKAHGLNPQIQVLQESYQLPTEEESQLLKSSPQESHWCREVLISHELSPILYAKALIPAEALTGPGRALLDLGDKALGSFLFAQADLRRSPFEFQQYTLSTYSPEPLEGRRSTFHFQGKSLLLTEVFLPGLLECLSSLA